MPHKVWLHFELIVSKNPFFLSKTKTSGVRNLRILLLHTSASPFEKVKLRQTSRILSFDQMIEFQNVSFVKSKWEVWGHVNSTAGPGQSPGMGSNGLIFMKMGFKNSLKD